jgi:hypothetical protein
LAFEVPTQKNEDNDGHAPFFSKAKQDHDGTGFFRPWLYRSEATARFQEGGGAFTEMPRFLKMRLPGQDKVIEASVVIGLDELRNLFVASDQRGSGSAAYEAVPGPDTWVDLKLARRFRKAFEVGMQCGHITLTDCFRF